MCVDADYVLQMLAFLRCADVLMCTCYTYLLMG